ncbi:uncharacterized protein LOC127287973 [Leptopilina boulardi]|uniref:uncharacterized protein LOC127287973 n=1 Tax=Leptopilina boulardi TaxID=63433 RepID=UPI0021F53692|nr:uncharacterized protein LOC127287973 [Leptopilina boulardi]
MSVAWTGMAATLLINGKTVHTTFKLPLTINEQTICNINPNTIDGKKIKECQVIIWDKIIMTSKHAFEAVHRLLRDLCISTESFDSNECDIQEKVILAPRNNDVFELNVVKRMTGEPREYLSIDTSEEDEKCDTITNLIPIEVLNTLTPNGLPPHKLILKIACWVFHNICLSIIDEDIEDYIRAGAEIEDNEPGEPMKVNNKAEAEGMAKRDYIAVRL